MHHIPYFAAPGATITAMPNAPWTAGQAITLNCSVNFMDGHQNLNSPVITYLWTKNNGTGSMNVGMNSRTYFFHLNLSNAATYTCQAMVVNSSVISDRVLQGEIRIETQGYNNIMIISTVH